MKEYRNGSYYINRKPYFFILLWISSKCVKQVLDRNFNNSVTSAVLKDLKKELRKTLEGLPYIGGGKNDHTWYLATSAWCLALFYALARNGKTVDEAGMIIYQSVKAIFRLCPRPVSRMTGIILFNRYFKRMSEQSKVTHKKEYTFNWVFNVFKNKGRDSEFAIDYLECGICKFFKVQGVSALVPYMCILDHIMCERLGWGLVRKTTIAGGGDKCDFRYKLGRTGRIGWPEGFPINCI